MQRRLVDLISISNMHLTGVAIFQESKDADKLSDDELASMQWAGHLARNNSPIVDHCLVGL